MLTRIPWAKENKMSDLSVDIVFQNMSIYVREMHEKTEHKQIWFSLGKGG